METVWFALVTMVLAMYVVLDGLNFGVGMVYPAVARAEVERRITRASISPVWVGYEVWLVVAGGLLFLAFPKAYAAGFSGFYLALIIVLWLLIFRGLALELRSHVDNDLWRQFWDLVFSGASFLLAIAFGTALGNLIRGVPLNRDGYFFVALWTDFTPGIRPGILDWYTLFMGLTSVAILAFHGANYLAMKTEGDLYQRADGIARLAGWASVACTILAILALPYVQPELHLNYASRPIGYLLPATGLLALGGALYFRRRQYDIAAFLASSLFILAMLGSTAWGMYPHLLRATTDPAFSLTAFNAATDSYGLTAGLWWFTVGFVLIIAYQVYAHWVFWGKVKLEE